MRSAPPLPGALHPTGAGGRGGERRAPTRGGTASQPSPPQRLGALSRRDVIQKARPGWREFRRKQGGKEAESSFPGDGLLGGRLVTGRGGPVCGNAGGSGGRGLWAEAHAGLFLPGL